MSPESYGLSRGRARNFCLGGPSCKSNIFIKTTPTYTYTHAFLLYTHTFLFDKLYIYIHTPNNNKKILVISIKIMFGGDFL